MAYYLLVKDIHVGSVILSLAGFVARGGLMLAGSPLLQARFVRVAPHVVDTVLLASAAWLAWVLHQYPFVHGWLTAKVSLLVAYVLLGSYALKRGQTRAVRVVCWLAAVAVYGFIVTIARAHHPLGMLAGLTR